MSCKNGLRSLMAAVLVWTGLAVSASAQITTGTLSGTVTGRGQVSIMPVSPRPPQTSDATSSLGATQPAPVAVATVSSSVAPKAE